MLFIYSCYSLCVLYCLTVYQAIVYFHLLVFTDIFAVCDLCHPRATCIQQGPLQYGCECVGGFEGDGINCTGEESTVLIMFVMKVKENKQSHLLL